MYMPVTNTFSQWLNNNLINNIIPNHIMMDWVTFTLKDVIPYIQAIIYTSFPDGFNNWKWAFLSWKIHDIQNVISRVIVAD